MIDTVLFDLDGTLLQMDQNEFIKCYFGELSAKLATVGLDPEKTVKAVWAGTAAMVKNNGEKRNQEQFWDVFSAQFSELTADEFDRVVALTDQFYREEFNRVKKVVTPTPLSNDIVKHLRRKNYSIVLATNPLFPLHAVETRLTWAGMDANDFSYITSYENSCYCKPNPEYYREIVEKLSLTPERCLMVGNNVAEDMIAEALGFDVHLITDFIENEHKLDYSQYSQSTLAEFAELIDEMPSIILK